MASTSASVMGPLVPSPTTTTEGGDGPAMTPRRIVSPSDHWRLTAAFTCMFGTHPWSGCCASIMTESPTA